ncbi:MAG TPA: AAA family ATPase [Dehalococcoidia bacterium]|nr:AAA family ATPase [Dehalococcoidia bacterium]
MTSPSVPRVGGFFGREVELAALDAGLEAAIAGVGHLAWIAGEPGIGKTRLAAALAMRAGLQGVRALWGRCSEDAGAPAFWPWIQIIRGYVRDHEPHTVLAQMGAGAADIAQVVPQVREWLPDLPAPPPLEPEQARFRFFDSVAAFLHNAARVQPLLLVLDDLHWADRPSLLLLEFLGWELHRSRLLVVGTYRGVDVDREQPLARTIAVLMRAHLHERHVLGGLAEADVVRCLAEITGVEPPAELVAAVLLETAGNPFFVTEIARRLAAEARSGGGAPTAMPGSRGDAHGPLQLLEYRLSRLPPACRRVLTIAAVIGREFGVRELERVTELAGDAPLELLEHAEVARLIAAMPGAAGRYRFSHALIREALYEELPTTRRMRLHRQVAEALEAVYGEAAHPHQGQLAHHFVQAAAGGDADKAVAYARLAGESALASLAYEEAARYFIMALQALDLLPRPDEARRCALLLSLGVAQNWSGEVEAARQTFQNAAAIARRLGDAEGMARAALGYGAVADAGPVDHVRVVLLEQALAALGERDDALRVMVLAGLSAALYWSEQAEPSIALSRQALDVATRLEDPAALAHALNARREALWRPQHLRERFAAGEAMRKAAAASGDQELMLAASRWLVADLLELGDGAALDKEIAAHAMLADSLRQPLHLWRAARWRAMRALLFGRFAEAEELVQRALALGRRTQRRDATPLFIVQWGALRRLQGRAAELEPWLRELVERFPDTPVWRAALATVRAEQGEADAARGEFERLARGGFEGIARDANWLVALTSLAEVCACLGDGERAAVLYDLLLPYAEQLVVAGAAVVCLGAVAHYLGLLAALLARWDAAEGHFARAQALHARLGAKPWLATTHYEHAAMLLARGDPGERARALELVAEALTIAQDLGMARLVERALNLQQRDAAGQREVGFQGTAPATAGAAAPAGARTAAGAPAASRPRAGTRRSRTLTAREQEVARLLARGLSNRQIAAALVISERTADAHVANIFDKLGLHKRAQVAAWATAHGLHSPAADA